MATVMPGRVAATASCLLKLSALAGCCFVNNAFAQNPQPYSLVLTAEPPNGIKPDDPLIGIDLRNMRYEPIHVMTTLSAILDYIVVVTDQKGALQEKTKIGKLKSVESEPIKNPDGSTTVLGGYNTGFKEVVAGSSLHEDLDLKDLYDLPPGHYLM